MATKQSYTLKSPPIDGARIDLYPITSSDEVIVNAEEVSLSTDNVTLNEYLEIMNDTYGTKEAIQALEDNMDEMIQDKVDEATQTLVSKTDLYQVSTSETKPDGPAIWLMDASEATEVEW